MLEKQQVTPQCHGDGEHKVGMSPSHSEVTAEPPAQPWLPLLLFCKLSETLHCPGHGNAGAAAAELHTLSLANLDKLNI